MWRMISHSCSFENEQLSVCRVGCHTHATCYYTYFTNKQTEGICIAKKKHFNIVLYICTVGVCTESRQRRLQNRRQTNSFRGQFTQTHVVNDKLNGAYLKQDIHMQTPHYRNYRIARSEFSLDTQFVFVCSYFCGWCSGYTRLKTYRQLILFYSCDFSMHKTSAFRWCRSEWRIHRFARPKVYTYYIIDIYLCIKSESFFAVSLHSLVRLATYRKHKLVTI